MHRSTLPHKVRLLGALVAVLALLSVPMAPQSGAESVTQAKAKLNHLLKQIRVARGQQARLQAQLDVMAGRMSKVQDHMAQTEFAMQETRREIELDESGIAAQQSALDARARMAYESGPGSTLEIVLGSTSASDLNERLAILDAAAQADKDVINQLTDQTNTLHIQQNQLLKQRAALLSQQAALQSQQDALNANFQRQASLVKDIAANVTDAKKLIKRLQTSTQIPGYPGGGGGPAIPGVLFACPVQGPHAYSDDFGAPRPGHIHAGVDIMAPYGTPIVAPFPGRVVRGWDPGGGNDVYVYGSWGYVFNAHLSRYAATGNVSTGTVIGYVGATGDATGPHDHFEVHPKHLPAHLWRSPYGYTVVGTAIDGYPYLNSVC